VFVKDPESGNMAVILQNGSIGCAAREDGSVMVKMLDIDTGIPIFLQFQGEDFPEVAMAFQKVAASRIVTADPQEVARFGRNNPDPAA
jgi:hypothetical protein